MKKLILISLLWLGVAVPYAVLAQTIATQDLEGGVVSGQSNITDGEPTYAATANDSIMVIGNNNAYTLNWDYDSSLTHSQSAGSGSNGFYYTGNHGTGHLTLAFQIELLRLGHIPTLVANDGQGARPMSTFLPNPSNHFAVNTQYGKTLNKFRHCGGINMIPNVRFSLFFQGEGDAVYPLIAPYRGKLESLYNSLRSDYPNLRYEVVIQCRPPAVIAYDTGHRDIAESQRQLMLSHPDTVILVSSNGVPGYNGVHGDKTFYDSLGHLAAQMLWDRRSGNNFIKIPNIISVVRISTDSIVFIYNVNVTIDSIGAEPNHMERYFTFNNGWMCSKLLLNYRNNPKLVCAIITGGTNPPTLASYLPDALYRDSVYHTGNIWSNVPYTGPYIMSTGGGFYGRTQGYYGYSFHNVGINNQAPGAALPIDNMSFIATANLDDATIEIRWKYLSGDAEPIEKSTDGENYTVIGYADASNHLIDAHPSPGNNYYRCGHQTAHIWWDVPMQICIYPNPTSNDAHVSNVDLDAEIDIRNIYGILIFHGNLNNGTVSLQQFPSGCYRATVGERNFSIVKQ